MGKKPRGQLFKSRDGAVTTQMSLMSEKKTTEQLVKNDLTDEPENTLDLKRF